MNTAVSEQTGLKRDKLAISGMRCAACAQIIEYRLRAEPGVVTVRMLPASARVELEWQTGQTSLQRIVDTIVALGYRALPLAEQGKVEDRAKKVAWWRLFVAGFAMMQVMMYAFPAWLEPNPGPNSDLTPDIDLLLKLASLALSIPVLIFSSMPFYQGAWRDLRNRHIGMDVPITLGILATFFASLWATFAGGAVYYDSMIMFVFLLLAARMFEQYVQERSNAALRELTALLPLQAQICRGYPNNRNTESILASELKQGDVFLVAPGSQIPADGVVLEGQSACDEALMTGESRAVHKKIGSQVIAGAMNLAASLLVRAEQTGDATRLSHLVAMMESAANQKPALVQLADRHASRFLLAVMLLAGLSGLVWWQIDASRALPIALSVLVITCPCALSLATPSVMAAVTGLLAKRGVLVARGNAIEALARASHIVFDKTGTLTEGRLSCSRVHLLNQDQAHAARLTAGQAQTPEAAWRMLAAQMAQHSLHPASLALQQDTVAGKLLQDVQEIAGQGVQASSLNGQTLRLGRLDFVQQLHGQAQPTIDSDASLVALGDETGWLAIFELQDQLRPDARALLDYLRGAGKQIYLFSGDRHPAVLRTANALHINADHLRVDLLPQDKYQAVVNLQAQGAKVAVIGDGMNDGPVLSIADVSVAMGQGAPITQARSDLVLTSSSLADLQLAHWGAQRALQLIRQNLWWALLYNLVAIPAAMLGTLSPWAAALGMSASSLLVVLNSLRMLRLPATYQQTGHAISTDPK